MALVIREVSRRRDRRRFIRLPFVLHRGDARWVPPLLADERRYFDPARNPSFAYSDATLALAERDGRPCGRIMGIINRRYNERTARAEARFACLESEDDAETVTALLAHVEHWARAHGMRRVVGPLGFTDQDPEGFMVEGFGHVTTLATYANEPFLPRLVEAAGYAKDEDYVVYRIDLSQGIDPRFEAVVERIRRQGNYRLLDFRSRRDLKPWVRPVLDCMNEAFRELYAYDVLAPGEIELLARRFLPLIDYRHVQVGVQGDTVVGFLIGMPNLSEGFRRARGRLFPFGLMALRRAARQREQFDILIGGVLEAHRRRGLEMLGLVAMLKAAAAAGFRYADSHHELERNTLMTQTSEKLGGTLYKRFRVFGKDL